MVSIELLSYLAALSPETEALTLIKEITYLCNKWKIIHLEVYYAGHKHDINKIERRQGISCVGTIREKFKGDVFYLNVNEGVGELGQKWGRMKHGGTGDRWSISLKQKASAKGYYRRKLARGKEEKNCGVSDDAGDAGDTGGDDGDDAK